jgi:biotin operon repressor
VTGYHGPRILVALAERPYSGRELAGLLDCSESEVRRCVGRLRRDGHLVENLNKPGSRYGGMYVLRTADYYHARTCEWPECGAALSIYNDTSYCRVHRFDAALDAIIDRLARDVESAPVTDADARMTA